MKHSNKIIIPIKGMHCTSCEIIVEEKLTKIPEIIKVKVSATKQQAEIFYDSIKPDQDEIKNAILEAGYEVGQIQTKNWFTAEKSAFKDLGIAFLFLVITYLVLKSIGLTNINIGTPSDPSQLSVVLLVGLTAGISTCMALIGGLVLGLSASYAVKHPQATTWQKFRPHIYFNIGRLVSYAILGGILGLIGSVLQLSSFVQGIVTIVVGLVMLLTGLKLIGIFPKLENFNLTLPKSITQFLGIKTEQEQEYSHSNSFWLGAFTFFLPCGFTQAMQLLAISSGNFWSGSLIMVIFALGTSLGLLGIGGITSVVNGIFAKRFFKFAGLVVIVLAFFNVSNGLNLAGWQIGFDQRPANTNNNSDIQSDNGVQIVRMEENYSGYSPNKFIVKKDKPVRWIIDAKAPNSCASSIVVPKMNIRKYLSAGENVIEFTPTKLGTLNFSCAMGMYTGSFEVTE